MKSSQDKTDQYNYQITATNSTSIPPTPQKKIVKKMLIKKNVSVNKKNPTTSYNINSRKTVNP